MPRVAKLLRRVRRVAPIVACLVLVFGAPTWAQPAPARTPVATGDWRDPKAWQRLRLGMSPAQVVAHLGEPGKVTTYYAFVRWEYPDALGLRVNFDERGRLSAWSPIAR